MLAISDRRQSGTLMRGRLRLTEILVNPILDGLPAERGKLCEAAWEISPAHRAGVLAHGHHPSCRRRAVAALWRAAKAEGTVEIRRLIPSSFQDVIVFRVYRGRCPRLIFIHRSAMPEQSRKQVCVQS